MRMQRAIQCTDDRTQKVGCFGFTHGRKTTKGIRFSSQTPVFDTLPELFKYCDYNRIIIDNDLPILEYGTNKPLY